MAYATADNTRRWPGALAAIAVEASIAVFIVKGLAARFSPTQERLSPPLVAFDQRRPEPPPPPPPPKPKAEHAEGGAPPGAKAAPREAPRPKIAIAPPRPAAPVAGSGTAAQSGAAEAGNGSGAGGTGNGTGTGNGSGNGSGATSPPVRVAGGISDRDNPRGAVGNVAISFHVRSDGRVDRCSVIGSSGDGELDGLTCALVERRFVYRPARDAAGQPRDTTLRTTFTWGVRGR